MANWSLNTPEPVAADALAATLRGIVEAERELEDARAIVAGQPKPERNEAVDRQRDAAIVAAAAIARGASGKRFHASLSGHVDPDHSDGIEDRVAVYVDSAP